MIVKLIEKGEMIEMKKAIVFVCAALLLGSCVLKPGNSGCDKSTNPERTYSGETSTLCYYLQDGDIIIENKGE